MNTPLPNSAQTNSPQTKSGELNQDPNRFNLYQDDDYKRWRDVKLAQSATKASELIVDVKDINQLRPSEYQQLLKICQKNNAAIYVSETPLTNKTAMRRVCAKFGLMRLDSNLCAEEDGISALHVVPKGQRREYIPYSDHAINWHTDGYYNTLAHAINGMVLHCVCPAASGGENGLIDHELIYIHLRDHNPAYITALMQDDAMTIPANIQNGQTIRAEQSGPVFTINAQSGSLHMRYTARTRSIEWKDDEITSEAVAYLEKLLNSNASYQLRYRLQAGQGLITNNALHCRTAFKDNSELQRLVYRARFFDRVQET